MSKKRKQHRAFEREKYDTIAQGNMEWGPIWEDLTWDQAKALEIDGWRLPTIAELVSLFDYEIGEPLPLFKRMKGKVFWTHYSIVGYPYNSWHVNFYFGFVYFSDKSNKFSVRFIRNRKDDIA